MSEQELNEYEFYQWVGRRLRVLREKAGMKKKDLAEKIGISPTFLSNVENDGKKISAYQINRILKILGYNQADLLDDEGKKNSLSPSMATC